MRRSLATPWRNVGCARLHCLHILLLHLLSSRQAALHRWLRGGPRACSSSQHSTVASTAKTTPRPLLVPPGHPNRGRGPLSGSSQPTTAASPASAAIVRQPPPLLTGDHAQRLAQSVSQQVIRVFHLAAPHSGLLSSAARKRLGPKAPLSCATSIVRSISRRSHRGRSAAGGRRSASPLLNGGSAQSRQSSTSCQRRSIVVASITSSSETPV